jgi:hypothetical protein
VISGVPDRSDEIAGMCVNSVGALELSLSHLINNS